MAPGSAAPLVVIVTVAAFPLLPACVTVVVPAAGPFVIVIVDPDPLDPEAIRTETNQLSKQVDDWNTIITCHSQSPRSWPGGSQSTGPGSDSDCTACDEVGF